LERLLREWYTRKACIIRATVALDSLAGQV